MDRLIPKPPTRTKPEMPCSPPPRLAAKLNVSTRWRRFGKPTVLATSSTLRNLVACAHIVAELCPPRVRENSSEAPSSKLIMDLHGNMIGIETFVAGEPIRAKRQRWK